MVGPFKTNFFFENEVQRVLYKPVTYYPDHSRIEDLQPLKLQVYSTTKKIKFVPITTIVLPKINVDHLELLKPLGPQSQLPGSPRFT